MFAAVRDDSAEAFDFEQKSRLFAAIGARVLSHVSAADGERIFALFADNADVEFVVDLIMRFTYAS